MEYGIKNFYSNKLYKNNRAEANRKIRKSKEISR